MGLLRLEDLAGDSACDEHDPPLSRPIAAFHLHADWTAMRIVEDPTTGRLVFDHEVPVTCWRGPRRLELASGRSVSWVRVEMSIAKAALREGERLALAEHPWSNEWHDVRPFRPPERKGSWERGDRHPRSWGDLALEEVIARVDALDFDPFQKGRRLTAAWSLPRPAQRDGGRNRHDSLRYALGLVRDPDRAFQCLWECEAIQAMRRRPPAFWHKRAPAARLRDEVADECDPLLALSIHQALAGPVKPEYRKGASWTGRPVTDLVDRIFREHLNRRNRAVARRGRKERQDSRPA